MPGQGPSCDAGDLWEVLLETGETVLTHGGDPPILHSELQAPPRPVACAASQHYRSELVYARPVDRPGRYRQVAPLLRRLVEQTNGQLHAQAAQLGVSIDYAFLCDADGVVVRHVVLPSTSLNDSFSSIVSGLQAVGLRDTRAKYWVFYDDSVSGGFAGQGTIHRDDRATADNDNDRGPDYAISYGELDAALMMHENAHTMGAVQLSAPHSTGAWHCNDGRDVMCYDDGGPAASYTASSCAAIQFDCGFDDYFHPRPAPDSYLSTRWNTASALNRFLRFDAPRVSVTGPSTASSPAGTAGATPRLRCLGRRVTHAGTSARDRLRGTRRWDVIAGRAGADRISGFRGAGWLCGDGGADALRGGAGADRLHGGAGNDTLFAGVGRDRLTGGRGRDRLHGHRGRDSIRGGPGNDLIRVRDGERDSVSCGSGRDRVIADRRDRTGRDCERVIRR